MFDVATTPVGNKLNVIKKNVVASAKKKTPAKRAPKPRGEVMSAPATKRRKVLVPDELTEIPTKQIMDQLADTTAITVMETYLPTSQRTIDLLAARKNRDYLKPMHSGLNPKLSALFSTNEIMPLGPVKFTKNDNVDGASSVRSIRESLVIVNREKSASLEEEEEDAEVYRIEPEQSVLRREVDEVSDRASEVPAGNFDTYDAASSNGWDDRAFPADEDFAPMEDASLALPSVHEPSMQKASSARASVEPLPSRPVLTEEELSVQEVAQSENEYFQDLVEDESVAPEEEADVSLTNGESMSRSTMTTIELLQHKFSRSKSLTLNQLLPKKPKKPEAARMFFEMLVLKTKNLIDVEQNEAYGTIKLTEMPLLSAQIAA
ncbi:hypothetical protein HDU79_009816 [Rhizoclosmatium sp. JEL0117]|nr:hypothetical protein HDU79_009816 [Rhizoclosmatium sp. JEL0117]